MGIAKQSRRHLQSPDYFASIALRICKVRTALKVTLTHPLEHGADYFSPSDTLSA